MKLEAADLGPIFDDCLSGAYQTRLEGGSLVPIYLLSKDLTEAADRVIYHEDYLASALHEVANWCLPDGKRRLLKDHEYGYLPGGRTAAGIGITGRFGDAVSDRKAQFLVAGASDSR